MSTLEKAVGEWVMAGCSVAPALPGKKRPMTPTASWQGIASGEDDPVAIEWTVAQIRQGHADGIGIFCGLASGGVECLETDGDQSGLLMAAAAVASDRGIADLWHRVMISGCVETTPSGGRHHYLRVTDGPCLGNMKLALPAPAGDPIADAKATAETRGQGGWVVVAPSAGRTHPSRLPYSFVAGSPATIPDVTALERDALYDVIRGQCRGRREVARPATLPPANGDPNSIGNQFAAATTWADVLEGAGWRFSHADASREFWTRPGKDDGVSAVTGGDLDVCYAFSSSTSLFQEGAAFGRFRAFVRLHFADDYRAATKYLARCREAGFSFAAVARGMAPHTNNTGTVAGEGSDFTPRRPDDVRQSRIGRANQRPRPIQRPRPAGRAVRDRRMG